MNKKMVSLAEHSALTQSKTDAESHPKVFPGLWVLLTLDLGIFMFYFLAFTIDRAGHEAICEQGRQSLNASIAFANTLILLTSSLFVVKAVDAARKHLPKIAEHYLQCAILCGLAFVVLKISGYVGDALAGHYITTNIFYGYYYAITGLHFFHLLLGLFVLTACFLKVRKGDTGDKVIVWLTSAGCFWHLVDMLWVMIFPLFYLLRTA